MPHKLSDEISPKVSIIIPVYNGSKYLGEAIDSALAQTYKNIEVIVVNDGSVDGGETEAIAKTYGDRIKYFSKSNGGVSTALNLGIKNMSGSYFSWLSHDDRYKKNKIEKQINYLKSIGQDDVILFSDYDLIDSEGKRIKTNKIDHQITTEKPLYSLLKGMINGITLLIPIKAFEINGSFDKDLRCTQDYDMWFKMYKDFNFIHMPMALSETRLHPNQDTVSNPYMIKEGNELWPNMISKISDKQKIEMEGSLDKFYFEMANFLRPTPYKDAYAYCQSQLEVSFQNIKYKSFKEIDNDLIYEKYYKLINAGEKRSAAYYFESVVKFLHSKNKAKLYNNIIDSILIGGSADPNRPAIINNNKLISAKSNKKKVLFCSGYWLTGGMERALSLLFQELKDDYELFLLTPYDGRTGTVFLPDYVNHIKISTELFDNNYDTTLLAYSLIYNIDVVVGFMNLFFGQMDFYNLSAVTRIKTIASNHEMYFYPYMNPVYLRLINRRLDSFTNADAVLWETNFSAAAHGLNANNSFLMPNPNTFIVSHNNIPKHKNLSILAVGRFNDYVKRIDRILETFSIVSKQIPEANLVLVGKCDRTTPVRPSDNASVDQLMKIYGIDPNKVKFIGEVDNVEKYYKDASLLLVASESEGFGLVINEAAAFGVPVVCNTIPGLEDLIEDGENGYLIEQGNIKSLADTVIKILNDSKLRNKLSIVAKSKVRIFERSAIGDKWRFLIETLTTENDKNKLRDKLNLRLSYKYENYHELSKVIFKFMNQSAVENYKFMDMKVQEASGGVSGILVLKLKKLKHRLYYDGLFNTTIFIFKKIYNLVRNAL